MAEDNVTYSSDERFERLRSRIGLALGPLLAIGIALLPMPALTPAAHTLAAILTLVIVWWVTEPLPIPVTGLIGLALCVLLGVESSRKVFAAFSDPVIFLFIGSFILAQAMSLHKLDERLAFSILALPGVANHPLSILFVFGLLASVLSMWVSNTATTAMLLPIGIGVLHTVRQLEVKEFPDAAQRLPTVQQLRFSSALVLIMAFGAGVGGVATPVGSPPNLIGIGLIDQILGVKISFFQWMRLGLPLALVMFLVVFAVLALMFPSELKAMHGASSYIREKKRALGPLRRGEKNVLLAFGLTVVLWVAPGLLSLFLPATHPVLSWYAAHLPEAVAALIGAGLLFVLPVNFAKSEFTTNWKNAAEIDWGTVLLFGCGLTFGALMFTTGLATAMGAGLLQALGLKSLWSITLMSIILSVIITDFASNTAAANMVIPVVISISQAAGVNPVPPALGACIGASFAFLLPVSTPPNAIAYASGMLPITRMIKSGAILSLLGVGVIYAGVTLLIN
ncbi:MAG: DASS family sodium-coupled anion symporter [Turneriella sp.]